MSNGAEIITAMRKGDRLHSKSQGLTAVDSELNNLCSAFGLPVEEVDQPLKKLIGDNPQTTESLLPVTAEQARIWSNTEKLEPQKRIELQYKLYQDDAFRKKCLEDPEEVLRFGGVMLDVARGVSKKDFLSSVKDFATNPEWGERAWELFEKSEWKALEEFVTAKNINKFDNKHFPPNDGFINIENINLEIDSEIDRYGGIDLETGFTDNGRFVANAGSSFESRALPIDYKTKIPYKKYKVIKTIPMVKKGQAIPWFNQVGKGIQYQLPYGISELLEMGYIVEK